MLPEAGPGGPKRIDARLAILVAIGFVIAVVATPLGSWKWYAAEGLLLAFVMGVVGGEPGPLLRRWLGMLVVVAFLGGLLAVGHPLRGDLGLAAIMGSVLIRSGLSLLAVLLLGSVLSATELLRGLRGLGVPALLVSTLHFMIRYLHVLGEERERMLKARRSRTFRRTSRLEWVLMSGLVGLLFVRAMERGERVHAAMRSRGWDGTLRSLDGGEG